MSGWASIGSITTLDCADGARVSEILEPGAEVGRYVIRAYLGGGGMGVVYAAADPALDREVALKLLRRHLAASPASSRMEDRLLREAQSMARLAHPNVVAVHDAGRIGDQVFIAMELVAGSTLKEWLEGEPRADLRPRAPDLRRPAGQHRLAPQAARPARRGAGPSPAC